MQIEVTSNPPMAIVNGLRIVTAPPIAELLHVLGVPSRVDSGPNPAPVGFRNNQRHVYDLLGIHVNEHHHTRRAQAIEISLSADEPRYEFTPKSPFTGQFLLDGVVMPLHAFEQEFLSATTWHFENWLGGKWDRKFGGFYVGFDAVGPKLKNGKRSKRRVVVDISVSWPHDPNGPPPLGCRL